MVEHYCEVVIEWELVEDDPRAGLAKYSRPLEICNKVARFETALGTWLCAEHWDAHIKEVEKMSKEWQAYDQGICKICNCEFHNGECNCQYYQFG
jgi:hypothetical protein